MNESELNRPRCARRKWFQISMRTCLVAFTAFSLWLGLQANVGRQQRIAVAALEQAGVTVFYDFQFDTNGRVVPDARPRYPEMLVRAIGIDFFAKVKSLSCQKGNLDDVVTHCAKLRDVTGCFLGGSNLSDEGLRCVTKMPNLEQLGLEYTQVSDQGLNALLKLPNLKVVLLMGTNEQVSEDMIERLEQSLPDCEFFCDPRRYRALTKLAKQLETLSSGKARKSKTVDGVVVETTDVFFKGGGLRPADTTPKNETPFSLIKKITSQPMGRIPTRTIDGIDKAMGFSIGWSSGRTETIWIDPKTGLPIRCEVVVSDGDGKTVTTTFRNIEFSIIDESAPD